MAIRLKSALAFLISTFSIFVGINNLAKNESSYIIGATFAFAYFMGALGILGTLRSVNMYIKKIDTLSIFALFASAFNIFVGINNVLKHGNLFMISVNFSCAIFTGFLAVSFTMRR